MIILDTNVISEIMRERPDEKVTAWLDRQVGSSIWTTAINVFEVAVSIQMMLPGRKRSLLTSIFDSFLDQIERRITAFDFFAARQAAELEAVRGKKGRPMESRDTMIAGIVLSHSATFATRNTAHFADVLNVLNPWNE